MFETLRYRYILPKIRGRLLDVGCGDNALVRHYQHLTGWPGWGIDIHGTGADCLVAAGATLPFDADRFDTVTLVATFNHVDPQLRLRLLQESARVTKRGGQLLMTCISPWVSLWLHRTPRLGCSRWQVVNLLKASGWHAIQVTRFQGGLNRCYQATR